MADKRCGNCKWRGQPPTRLDPDYFLCGKIDMQPDAKESSEKAYVIDGSGYYAALCVSTDFGCTEWESIISDTEPPKAA